jgi:hypothetical protein
VGRLEPEYSGFRTLPGVSSPDGVVNSLLDYDWGPEFDYNDLSGAINKAPGSIRQVLPTLVAKTDADRNDRGGVPSVLLQVPLGTYVGWNVTAAGFNQGKICGLNGGYIPFAKTKAERMAANDPVLSIEERYGTHDKYVALVDCPGDTNSTRKTSNSPCLKTLSYKIVWP